MPYHVIFGDNNNNAWKAIKWCEEFIGKQRVKWECDWIPTTMNIRGHYRFSFSKSENATMFILKWLR